MLILSRVWQNITSPAASNYKLEMINEYSQEKLMIYSKHNAKSCKKNIILPHNLQFVEQGSSQFGLSESIIESVSKAMQINLTAKHPLLIPWSLNSAAIKAAKLRSRVPIAPNIICHD